jgi:hypothetical protein
MSGDNINFRRYVNYRMIFLILLLNSVANTSSYGLTFGAARSASKPNWLAEILLRGNLLGLISRWFAQNRNGSCKCSPAQTDLMASFPISKRSDEE